MLFLSVLLLTLGVCSYVVAPPPDHGDHHTHDPLGHLEHEIEEIYHHYADELCPHINNVDCSLHNAHHDEVLCGSDFKIYADHCLFAVAHCNDSTLTVRHKGPCDILASVPSVNPTNVDPAFAIIKDIFCQNLHLITCGTAGTDNVCATDGIVYNSRCMFSKTKCYKTDIEVTDGSFCGLTTQAPQTTTMPMTTAMPLAKAT